VDAEAARAPLRVGPEGQCFPDHIGSGMTEIKPDNPAPGHEPDPVILPGFRRLVCLLQRSPRMRYSNQCMPLSPGPGNLRWLGLLPVPLVISPNGPAIESPRICGIFSYSGFISVHFRACRRRIIGKTALRYPSSGPNSTQ
jgi:hypothetical protein